MKCLFVRSPFAGWIVDGVKTVEYRTQPTRIRGKIGIIQSKSGTVIGEVEITGCEWNESLEHYEWSLANGARYVAPLSFQHKNGAVVWIDVPDCPANPPLAAKLTAQEYERQLREYQLKIDGWLHPEKHPARFFAVMRDGRRLEFDNEEEMDHFAEKHRAECDHAEVLD